MRYLGLSILVVGLATTAVAADREVAPLVSNTTIQAGDSALVRAAKRTLALRKKNRVGSSSEVIDNARVARSRGALSGPTGPVPPITSGGVREQDDAPQAKAAPDRSKEIEASRRREELKQEMSRMVAESDEPYGGDVEEDTVDRRLNTIPQEIQQTTTQKPPDEPLQ